MGLLDSITGQVLGSLTQGGEGGHAGLIAVLGGMLNNPQTGGLAGLISAFERNGLGDVVASWVGTGQNLPVSADQLQSVLGSEQIQAIAQQLGFNPQQLLGHLTELLPQMVDGLTPGGVVPDAGSMATAQPGASDGDISSELSGALGGLLGSLRGPAT